MKHGTTCLPNGGGIGLPDAHAATPVFAGMNEPIAWECTPSGTSGADICLPPGASPAFDSAALAASAAQVRAAATWLGIDPACFERYAVRRWGMGWNLHADGWRQALDEMERYRNDTEGFLDKIDTYLRLESRLA